MRCSRELRVVMRHALGPEAEGRRVGVARLQREARPVDRASIKPRRRSRLQTAAAQAELLQRLAEQNCVRFPGTSGRILLLAAVDQSVEKSAGGDDYSLRADRAAIAQPNAENAVPVPVLGEIRLRRLLELNCNRWSSSTIRLCHFRLLDLQIRLRLQHFAHLEAISLLVALRARRPHSRAARSVQQTELDADRIGDLAHDPAERIDFADQVSLGDAADRRIAGHLRNQVDVERVERGLQSHARRGHCRFAPGMACADHDYVELFSKLHLREDETPDS
jgi:transcriptional antiterminator Rof (Rho-off)